MKFAAMLGILRQVSFIVAFIFIHGACQTRIESGSTGEYKRNIDSLRRAKDNDFALGENSPFSEEEGIFEGLKYFPPDIKYRVEADWIRDTQYFKDIPDSKGGLRHYRYSGKLGFTISGHKFYLPIWIDTTDSSYLFIMFRDATNGRETYGGGRYIEMQYPGETDKIYLDFNEAFNPYCHYSHRYSCPIIPREIKLDIGIQAGEKKYK